MNLVVQSAFTLENELIDKFRRSTVANNKLRTYQINNGIDKPKKLLQDVQTRWNSTYYMLNRFIELEIPIIGTLGLLNKASQTLNSDEWTIIKELCTVLRPFEEATRAVSCESYMTASIVIVLTQGLLNACKKLHTMEFNERTLIIIKQLLDKIENRGVWKNVDRSKTLCRCTFLDPRFKNIPFNNNSLSETTKNEIIEKTANIINLERSNQLDEQNQDQPDYISIDTPSTSNSPSIWETIDTSIAKLIPSGTSKSRAIIEVQRYLEDGMLKRNLDPLKWWQEHKYNYPYLHILAKQTLCCLGTSVPCERIFSKAGLILNDRRCRLKSK
ncbi:zinc finger BED domain-containing protein 4-like, partial [Aphis craccivora]